MSDSSAPTPTPMVTPAIRALFFLALSASFAQFGATAALADVAKAFGHAVATGSLQAQVGLSGSAIGQGLAILRIASLGALPLTAWADRQPRAVVIRRTMVTGLVVTSLASLSPNYWFFVACFALGKPFLSAASTLIQVVVVEVSSARQRVTRLAIIAAGAGAGAGLSAILHSELGSARGFRLLFALALIPIFFVPPWVRRLASPPHTETPTRLGHVAAAHRGRLLRVALIVAQLSVIAGPANGFAFVYAESVEHLSPSTVAAVITCSAVSGGLGLLVSARVARRWRRTTTVSVGVTLAALLATLAYSGGGACFVVGYFLGVGAAGFVTPALTALGVEAFPHAVRATAAGWLVVAGVTGAALGLTLFGWLADVRATAGLDALRTAAAWTFLPGLVVLIALRRMPAFSDQEAD